MKVGVIGAGMSGLACAAELQRAGHQVTVFEKSRGPGGRAPTRWHNTESNPPPGFDHGTQYFHARSKAFRSVIEHAQAEQCVAVWGGRVVNLAYGAATELVEQETRWVGTPGMASLARFLAKDLHIRKQSRVAGLRRHGGQIQLQVEEAGQTTDYPELFDWVVSAMPCEQAQALFADFHPALAARAAQVKSSVNWTCMLSFDAPLVVDFDGAFVFDSPLGWVCRDSSKPGRAPGERWVLQATADWSGAHVQLSPDEVLAQLIDVMRNAMGVAVTPSSATAHRWLYGLPMDSLDCGYYLDRDAGLAACGDWLAKPRLEDAFLSGQSLAYEIKSGIPIK